MAKPTKDYDYMTCNQVREKLNEIIDELEYWKKAHIKLQEQHIRLQKILFKPQASELTSKSVLCPDCLGEGYWHDNKCEKCKGKGYL